MNYVFGDYELDTCLYRLQRAGQTVRLRPKVFRVCLYLLEHRDQVVSREELCAQVWSGQFISQATIEGVIRAVRQAVGDSGQTQGIIQTLHGYGYRFVADVKERPTKVAETVVSPASAVASAQEASAQSQTADVSVSGASALGPEPMLERVCSEMLSHDTILEDAYRADRRADTAFAEERTATPSPQSPRRLSMARVMRALAMLILVVLAGWGLLQGMRGGEVVPLDKSRIAVLPFLNLSAEPDRAYFADGMTEVVIARLSQVPGLTVIARTSVMRYKGTQKDVATIGRELGVGTILEGSVRKVDNQMRINAQLIDVVSQGYLWSQEYDREVTGVLGIQTDIATRVAQQLRVQLAAGAKRLLEAQGTGNPDAYTSFLPGR